MRHLLPTSYLAFWLLDHVTYWVKVSSKPQEKEIQQFQYSFMLILLLLLSLLFYYYYFLLCSTQFYSYIDDYQ